MRQLFLYDEPPIHPRGRVSRCHRARCYPPQTITSPCRPVRSRLDTPLPYETLGKQTESATEAQRRSGVAAYRSILNSSRCTREVALSQLLRSRRLICLRCGITNKKRNSFEQRAYDASGSRVLTAAPFQIQRLIRIPIGKRLVSLQSQAPDSQRSDRFIVPHTQKGHHFV